MKKNVLTVVIGITMAMALQPVMAQTTVKGVLVDEASGESEPYATVRVYKQKSKEKPVAMFLTREDGSFSQEVKGNGSFQIVFSSVGKEDLQRQITLGKEQVLNLDTLFIKESATALKGVEIVAQKPLVKMEVDKMSYNVAEDNDAKASTVLDMLRKVPMVTVDGQDNISVNGSSSFKVYVDGKPNPMFQSNPSMVFKSMPATAVKNIEVITNPGAKFDAEGAGGVLNIVMNRQDPMAAQSLNGVNGTVRVGVGTKSKNASAFVSGQQDKLSFSANVMANYNTPGTTETDMEQVNGTSSILNHSENSVKTPFTMGNISLGYELTPLSSLNASASITSMNMKSSGLTTTQMPGASFGYNYGMDTKMSRTSFSGNLDYQQFFNKERTSSLTLTYQLNFSPTKNEQRNDFNTGSTDFVDLTDRYSLSKERTTDHTFQADFSTQLATGQTLDLGAKLMTRRAASDADYYLNDILSPTQGMDYLYKNSILAGYAEYAGNWNNFGLKGGLRYEHTWQDVEYHSGNGQDFSTNYGSLVPTASLQYKLTQTSNLGLTYNMRISRPGITYLNPYVDRTDPNSLSYGNTDLDVEKSHNIALVFNTFSSKFMMNLNLHHNFTDNGISQYSFYDGNLLNSTYGNIVSRHQTGFSAYVNWLLTKDTRLFLNGGVDYTTMSSDALNAENSGWHANAMLGLQQTLPWDLKLGAFLITSSKNYTLQGWSSGFNMISANISKTLFNDRLTIGLQGMIGLSKGGNLKMETFSQGTNFSSHTNISIPMSNISLTISYSFGNSKRPAKQHVSKVTNDYIEQQSQGEMLNSVGSGNGTGEGLKN